MESLNLTKNAKNQFGDIKKNGKELTKRIGFWLDLENPYITYENRIY